MVHTIHLMIERRLFHISGFLTVWMLLSASGSLLAQERSLVSVDESPTALMLVQRVLDQLTAAFDYVVFMS